MTPEEIRLELFKRRKKGVNMAAIGRSLDPPVTKVAVLYVIDRRSKSQRIMDAVAEAIGKTTEEVFPEYYQKAG